MRNTFKLFCLLSLSFSLIAADRPVPKQLAGPASEFISGPLAPIDMAANGISSKSALLPVHLEQRDNDTWTWRGNLAIDRGDVFSMMVFSGTDENWEVSLRAPASKRMQPAHELYSELKRTSYGLSENEYPGDHYTFENMEAGNWEISIKADAPTAREGYVLYGSEGPARLYSYRTTEDLLVGNEVGFVTRGENNLTKQVDARLIDDAFMTVSDAWGNTQRLTMVDDGLHNDDLAGDGIFGASFVPADEGEYHVQILARGMSADGKPFLRTTEHALTVTAQDVLITDELARVDILNDRRMNIAMNVATFEGGRDKYNVRAEVWGHDADGNEMPISWVGGMVYVDDEQLNLGYDARWIGNADAQGPFELRNVRIMCPDTHTALARMARMPLDLDELPEAAYSASKTIDEEMLMGPRPERKQSASKAGSKLLLVHGYCSGNAWGPQQGYFANSAVFLDLGQNRSHDQFAIRIRDFGSSYDSFGIVAHSQGGAASLHLYTYYWSGLDYASGNRLIQSVGTPYQGTALAGNLAALGDVFGAGCGTNNDLTYNGASSWLNGIPSSARSKVHYFTTSFETKWWRYDYCHLATDLFLSDPEDGTTEKSKGQLSGGNNRGHKTGWCHTTGMRDPAQVTDGSRNSDMNANAAR